MKNFLSLLLLLSLLIVPLLISCSIEASQNATDTSENTQNDGSGNEIDTSGTAQSSENNTPEQENHFVSAEDREKAASDDKYKWAVAFLEKDIETCAKMAYVSYTTKSEDLIEMYEPLSTLTFGSYSLEESENSSGKMILKMNFTISDSGYDFFPVGEYEALLYDDFRGERWILKKPSYKEGSLREEYPDPICFIDHWFSSRGGGNYTPENWENWSYDLTINLFRLYESVYGPTYELSLEQIRSAAYDLYGIENFEPPLPPAGEWSDNGMYHILGRGAWGTDYEIININKKGSVYEIDLQYFGDDMYFSQGKIARFTVSETETVYGYMLEKIEVLEEHYPCFGYAT